MIQDVNFYIISILAVLILSAIIPFILKNYYLIPAVTLVTMLLAAFIITNFNENTSWEPLAGYAIFLFILSSAVTVAMWFYMRKRRKRKELEGHGKKQKQNEDEFNYSTDKTHK